jgi:hypothetical protein
MPFDAAALVQTANLHSRNFPTMSAPRRRKNLQVNVPLLPGWRICLASKGALHAVQAKTTRTTGGVSFSGMSQIYIRAGGTSWIALPPAISWDAIVQENSATVKRLRPSLIETPRMPFATCHSTAFANAWLAVSACAVKMQSSTLPLISNGMANPLGIARVTSHLFLRTVAKQNAAPSGTTLSKIGEHNLNSAAPLNPINSVPACSPERPLAGTPSAFCHRGRFVSQLRNDPQLLAYSPCPLPASSGTSS